MIDENRKCKEYLNNPEMLVKYVAEKLSIPFDSRKIWSGMTYYTQFITDCHSLNNFRSGSFMYEPFSDMFVINYPNYTKVYDYDISREHLCNNDTIKNVINDIIGSIADYQQHMKQKHINDIIATADSFEA